MRSINSAICGKAVKPNLLTGKNERDFSMKEKIGNPQATQLELAWLAGIVDGEGSFTMSYSKNKKAFTPKIAIANTDEKIISKAVTILDTIECFMYVNNKTQGHLGKKPVWYIQIERFKNIRKFLEYMLPYLIGKKAQGELMLRFVNLRIPKLSYSRNPRVDQYKGYTEEETKVALECRALNARGASTTNTQGVSKKETMIESELQGKLAELAEMTNRLSLGSNCFN